MDLLQSGNVVRARGADRRDQAWGGSDVSGPPEPTAARILIVDDNDANSELVREILLEAGYGNVQTSRDAPGVARLCRLDPVPDLLVLDLQMPGMSGFQVMAELGDMLQKPPFLPVLIVTADVTLATRRRALSLGAQDFLTKPVDAVEVLLRTRNLLRAHLLQRELNDLVTSRTRDLDLARIEVVQRLALAAEYRDDDTHHHIERVGRSTKIIATSLGLATNAVDRLALAAPLHDVGKIGIPDSILLKPGPLTDEEMRVMRTHVTIGACILAGSPSPVICAAAEIARFHHERWDGCGYLDGLAGEQIPLGARIAALADVFDALTHARPYKEAWTVERAVAEIVDQRGRAFDPAIVDAFSRLDHETLANGGLSRGDRTMHPHRPELPAVAA